MRRSKSDYPRLHGVYWLFNKRLGIRHQAIDNFNFNRRCEPSAQMCQVGPVMPPSYCNGPLKQAESFPACIPTGRSRNSGPPPRRRYTQDVVYTSDFQDTSTTICGNPTWSTVAKRFCQCEYAQLRRNRQVDKRKILAFCAAVGASDTAWVPETRIGSTTLMVQSDKRDNKAEPGNQQVSPCTPQLLR